jgi:hypothetical protein
MVHLINPLSLAQVRGINATIPDYALGGVDQLAGQEADYYAGYDTDSTTR